MSIVRGFRLTNLDNGNVYDVEAAIEAGDVTCDCGDAIWRQRPCKHVLALVAMHREGTI
jgi:hypothetical protein